MAPRGAIYVETETSQYETRRLQNGLVLTHFEIFCAAGAAEQIIVQTWS